jgi:hypothetical protein
MTEEKSFNSADYSKTIVPANKAGVSSYTPEQIRLEMTWDRIL